MVVTILLFSMEVRHEPPLVKLFAGIGFFWVGILFTMTLVDYLSRGKPVHSPLTDPAL